MLGGKFSISIFFKCILTFAIKKRKKLTQNQSEQDISKEF